MAYAQSEPLKRWLGGRRVVIDVLATGHAKVGELTGPGRPLDVSKPLAHAYVIVTVSQFQGFTRDLHDLAVERLVSASGTSGTYAPLLTEAIVSGRNIDRGNPTHRNIRADFARIGLSPLNLTAYNQRWSTPGDVPEFDRLIALRNAVGHSNETEMRSLFASGEVQDTVSWARRRLPVLNRYARALDHVVWDHMKATTGEEPW